MSITPLVCRDILALILELRPSPLPQLHAGDLVRVLYYA
jgi:hypothetical protein